MDATIESPSNRGLYFGGCWHEPRAGTRAAVTSPSTGEALGKVAWAGIEDVGEAVAAAIRGQAAWRALRPVERAKVLRAAAETVRAHGEELCLIDALDAGIPISASAVDVEIAAAGLEYFAGLATEIKGLTLPVGEGSLNYTLREPLGVVCRINAFNHPFMFAVRGAAAPLAAGNAVIVKPAEQAPLSSLRVAELLGPLFPAGVLSVLPGGRECGQALVAHPGIAKVSLIGSVPTGQAIVRAAADTLKKVSLELGGKNALVAYPDADVDEVAAGIIRGMNFGWAGQSCGSTSRVFIHEKIHDDVLGRVAAKMASIRIGMPEDPRTEMGCLIDRAQFDRVKQYIDAGRSEGARLVVGGHRPEDPRLDGGFFLKPTLFADVHSGMRIATEEIFGPVVAALRWRDADEMFAAVNGTAFGLTASIWTKDLVAAHRAAMRVEAGYVWINGSSSHFVGAPFGGYKRSGWGRDESIEEMLDFTQVKNVNVSLAS